MSLAIDLRGASKQYSHFQLRDVSLQVETGTVMGLIGPNGAGKSTTLKILTGMIPPDSGSVEVLSHRFPRELTAAKWDIGHFSEDMKLYGKATLRWHMSFVGSIYPGWDAAYAEELLKRFGLIADQKTKGLSHGQRVKALMLLVLARRPKLLVLDEPTAGLDPVAQHEVIRELMRVVEDESRTILFSSHDTRDVERICDHITFIDRGRVIETGDRDRFLENWRRLRLEIPDGATLPAIPGVCVEHFDKHYATVAASPFDDAIPEQLSRAGVRIDKVERMTLEEIFVSSVFRGRGE